LRTPPKPLEQIAALFPAIHMTLVLWALVRVVGSPDALSLAGLVGAIYAFPLAGWRIFSLFFPLANGVSYVGRLEKGGNGWLIANRLQMFFIAFPVFERALMLVPEAFSFWLRLWGSKVGHGVFWSPGVQVFDRAALDIGDFVIFGNDVTLSGHIVKRRRNRILVYYKPVTIGHRSLVGYASHIAPGVNVGARAQIEAGTRVYPNERVEGIDAVAQ
jgi:acetyltransferase-like isoleucine patch superfamily enzyme